jgi:hypothetical protein
MIPANPESDFAAIMTCSQADERLPIDHWCWKRFAITKIQSFDGTVNKIKPI